MKKVCLLILTLLLGSTIFGELSIKADEDEVSYIKNNTEEVSHEGEFLQVDGFKYYVGQEEGNLKVEMENKEGELSQFYRLNNKIYMKSPDGKIEQLAEIEETYTQGSISSRNHDTWNSPGTYKVKVDLKLKKLNTSVATGLLLACLNLPRSVNIGVELINAIVGYHNLNVNSRRYIYLKYNQTSWRGCPICIKTWNLYTYKDSGYKNLLSKDTREKISWLGHPQQNQYRAGCSVAVKKYW